MMKSKTFLLLIFLSAANSGFSQYKAGLNYSTVNIQPGAEKYEVNALIWVPPDYNKEKRYPLVIYGHGSGQAGQDLNQLLTDGLPSVLNRGFRPPFDCIIVCPQRASYSVLPEWLPGIILDMQKRFSIDSTRIYLTGTSAGGYMCYGSQLNVSFALSRKIAAICVISGATQDAKRENIEWWVRSKTHCWSIVGSEDQGYVRQNIFLINLLNQRLPGIATVSIRPGIGHGQWEEVYDGSFTDNNMNIWQWLYQYKLGAATQPPSKGTRSKSKKIALRARDKQVYSSNCIAEYDVQPGDTLVIPTAISSFLIGNFRGTAEKPVIIVPEDSGWLGGYVNYSGHISRASHFRVSGFHIDGRNTSHFGLIVAEQTGNYEVSHCQIRNVASIGLCAKQDPDSTKENGSWPAFSIENVSIHDIAVRNTGTEGFYLGYTFDVVKPLASPLVNLDIDNIRIDSTGWDGLQLSNCQNVRIRNITISNYGLKNQRGQQAGLLFGGMVTLKGIVRNVSVSNGTGAGLQIFGRGLMVMSGITLKNVGMSKGENAIFINDYQDLGFGLPPLRLDLENIAVNGSSGHALIVVNGNKTMIPGRIRNLTYSNTSGGIQDNIDQIVKN